MMKNHAPAVLRSSPGGLERCSRVSVRWLMGALTLVGITSVGRAQYEGIDIGVRSKIVDKPFGKPDRKDWPVHGKIYAIYSVQMIQSQEKLVKPVDATRLAGLVVMELDRHGYARMLKGQKPDVLISVLYGRGWLRNPYMAGVGPETPASAGTVGGLDVPSVSITGIPWQLFKEKGAGFETKVQKAQFEKLYIRVTAWQYPTDPKPKELWNTTMIVDDPDHRDLNIIAAQMLAAGGAYFDAETKEEEADVINPLQEGRVNVGTPEIMGDPLKPREK